MNGWRKSQENAHIAKAVKLEKMEKAEEFKECSVWYAKKTFAETLRIFSKELNYKAILMYLNKI